MNRLRAAIRSEYVGAAFLCVATLVAVPSGAAAAANVRDATGRTITVSDSSRIASIGGAITEILYALDLDRRIAAVDTTSYFPPRALKDKPNVGYFRQLSPEGVLSVSPSLVLATEGAGPKEALAVLQSASVPFVSVPDKYTGDGIVEKIRMIAAATDAGAKGECLAKAVQADLAALDRIRSQVTKPARVMFLLSFMNGKAMVAGKGTAADGIIRLAGGINAITEFEGYKIVGDEAIVAARPDGVLAMQRPDLELTAAEVFSQVGFSTTPAVAKKTFISMEGLYLLGFGPRTAQAARDLAHALYPDIEMAKLPSERGPSSDHCAQ